MTKANPNQYTQAVRHLARKNPALRPVIAHVGPCTLRVDPDHFATLVRSVLAQQISTRAAMTIGERLVCLCGKMGLRPKAIARVSDEELRGCGVSRSKLAAIRGLAEFFLNDPHGLRDAAELADEQVAQRLLHLRGIGPWTVEMFLIFSLGRLDVLPVADLGLRAGVQEIYGLTEMPTAAEVREIAEPWRPYRTIATWYCWKRRGPVPQS
jgi:DNA-3-methyladenine glycosylase II